MFSRSFIFFTNLIFAITVLPGTGHAYCIHDLIDSLLIYDEAKAPLLIFFLTAAAIILAAILFFSGTGRKLLAFINKNKHIKK